MCSSETRTLDILSISQCSCALASHHEEHLYHQTWKKCDGFFDPSHWKESFSRENQGDTSYRLRVKQSSHLETHGERNTRIKNRPSRMSPLGKNAQVHDSLGEKNVKVHELQQRPKPSTRCGVYGGKDSKQMPLVSSTNGQKKYERPSTKRNLTYAKASKREKPPNYVRVLPDLRDKATKLPGSFQVEKSSQRLPSCKSGISKTVDFFSPPLARGRVGKKSSIEPPSMVLNPSSLLYPPSRLSYTISSSSLSMDPPKTKKKTAQSCAAFQLKKNQKYSFPLIDTDKRKVKWMKPKVNSTADGLKKEKHLVEARGHTFLPMTVQQSVVHPNERRPSFKRNRVMNDVKKKALAFVDTDSEKTRARNVCFPATCGWEIPCSTETYPRMGHNLVNLRRQGYLLENEIRADPPCYLIEKQEKCFEQQRRKNDKKSSVGLDEHNVRYAKGDEVHGWLELMRPKADSCQTNATVVHSTGSLKWDNSILTLGLILKLVLTSERGKESYHLIDNRVEMVSSNFHKTPWDSFFFPSSLLRMDLNNIEKKVLKSLPSKDASPTTCSAPSRKNIPQSSVSQDKGASISGTKLAVYVPECLPYKTSHSLYSLDGERLSLLSCHDHSLHDYIFNFSVPFCLAQENFHASFSDEDKSWGKYCSKEQSLSHLCPLARSPMKYDNLPFGHVMKNIFHEEDFFLDVNGMPYDFFTHDEIASRNLLFTLTEPKLTQDWRSTTKKNWGQHNLHEESVLSNYDTSLDCLWEYFDPFHDTLYDELAPLSLYETRSKKFSFRFCKQVFAASPSPMLSSFFSPPSLPISISRPENTLIIWDWDDTILPTYYLAVEYQRQFEDIHLSNQLKEKLRVLEDKALQSLSLSVTNGSTIVVTNASFRWLIDSAMNYLPRLWQFICLNRLKILSARDICQPLGLPQCDWKRLLIRDQVDLYFEKVAISSGQVESAIHQLPGEMNELVMDKCCQGLNQCIEATCEEYCQDVYEGEATRDSLESSSSDLSCLTLSFFLDSDIPHQLKLDRFSRCLGSSYRIPPRVLAMAGVLVSCGTKINDSSTTLHNARCRKKTKFSQLSKNYTGLSNPFPSEKTDTNHSLSHWNMQRIPFYDITTPRLKETTFSPPSFNDVQRFIRQDVIARLRYVPGLGLFSDQKESTLPKLPENLDSIISSITSSLMKQFNESHRRLSSHAIGRTFELFSNVDTTSCVLHMVTEGAQQSLVLHSIPQGVLHFPVAIMTTSFPYIIVPEGTVRHSQDMFPSPSSVLGLCEMPCSVVSIGDGQGEREAVLASMVHWDAAHRALITHLDVLRTRICSLYASFLKYIANEQKYSRKKEIKSLRSHSALKDSLVLTPIQCPYPSWSFKSLKLQTHPGVEQLCGTHDALHLALLACLQQKHSLDASVRATSLALETFPSRPDVSL